MGCTLWKWFYVIGVFLLLLHTLPTTRAHKGHISAYELGAIRVERFEVNQFLAVMLFTNIIGMYGVKACNQLSRFEYIIPRADGMRFISKNILPY